MDIISLMKIIIKLPFISYISCIINFFALNNSHRATKQIAHYLSLACDDQCLYAIVTPMCFHYKDDKMYNFNLKEISSLK